MSFRQYGGTNYASKNNIVKNHYTNASNLSVMTKVGQPTSYINFESEYCLEYIIYEKEAVNYSIQLFACDVRASTNKLEFSEDVIMPLLFILDLQKEGKINPVALRNRISLAHDRIVPDSINLLISSNLKALERLCDLCIDYETDLSFAIKTVTDK